jgi:hypothetical protein
MAETEEEYFAKVRETLWNPFSVGIPGPEHESEADADDAEYEAELD